MRLWACKHGRYRFGREHDGCVCEFLSDIPLSAYRSNAWVTIHSRYATAIESGEWSEAVERHWLEHDFAKMVPCNSCGNKWVSLSESIDLSTAENAFRSVWEAHNTVSTQHCKPAKQPITLEQCKSLYLQQSSMDDCCVAVTSLSLLPNHREVQSTCLDSWKRFGLTIHAKNRSDEISELRELYPQVARWHACDDVPTQYATKTQSIHSLVQTSVMIDSPILLINSDIEIHGDQRLIREVLERGEVLVGIRHDYKDHWWTGTRFAWGLDAFSFTTEQAKKLPRDPYAIGKPVWDYWIPQHCRSVGQPMHFVGEPLFFHRLHKTNWSQSEWHMASLWFADRYGFMRTREESIKFRRSLPFPPD